MPVWADAFANEKQKAVWLTFLILASPLGVIFGYIMTSIYVGQYKGSDPNLNENWRWSFYTQCALLTPMSLGFLFTPVKYLDIDRSNQTRDKCQKKV